MRVVGVNLPDEKRIDIALTYIYGIGRSNVLPVLKEANIDVATRTKNLTEDEVKRLTRALDPYKIEGDLRAEIATNVRRLKDIGSYRGKRHAQGLPSRCLLYTSRCV